jgi:NADH-quinone oxidoreductase subunit C
VPPEGLLPDPLKEDPTLQAIESRFAGGIVEVTNRLNEIGLILKPDALIDFCTALKKEFGFERLSSVTAVDWWPKKPRFEVVYHVHSIRNNRRLRFKLRIDEGDEIESVTHIWTTANWYEREVFDLFGISFRNHPNLERVMMPADWEGHPLRKDYPVHGYKYSYADEG